jgi:hypothetical protein
MKSSMVRTSKFNSKIKCFECRRKEFRKKTEMAKKTKVQKKIN